MRRMEVVSRLGDVEEEEEEERGGQGSVKKGCMEEERHLQDRDEEKEKGKIDEIGRGTYALKGREMHSEDYESEGKGERREKSEVKMK